MAGDYSRQTHDPRKRFAAVLMQQGRIQIDADWNEQAAIALDRARRQARDTFGRAAVSRFSTDQAFRIGIVPGPPRDLSIAPGRMYVEGLLAEAFGADGAPISYLRQPFLPEPPALPASGGATVLLDVWQREVTWVEDPSLLDVALGGVDTAARLQTVWQVRVLSAAQPGCGLDPEALLPPSPARLTTRAVAPPAPDDPCLIAPKTGYRGLENRLYRVEVHAGGSTGAARFKFSRDNASVRSPVTAMRREMRSGREVTILTVSRIGRDPGLRFSAGDWVEITDEHRFLNGESGAMAQVAEPPLEEPGLDGFSVVLDRTIPPAGGRGFATTAEGHAERRTRIIRWDQAAPRNALDANGLMSLSGGMIELEDGVEVDFTLAGGTQYRTGDYWVFAARTADASVETLTAAPPHGPIHHAAQLAAITNLAANDDPADCRTLWPPLPQQGGAGCCTVVVRPGEDVQAAIDSLSDAGGCVCLKAGVHTLTRPLLIRRARVSLHAEAPGAAVLSRALEAPLLVVGGAATAGSPVSDITVAGIVFRLGGSAQRFGESALLTVTTGAERVRISECRFQVLEPRNRSVAVQTSGTDVVIAHCLIERCFVGVMAGEGATDLTVSECSFVADPADAEAAGRGAAAFPAADTAAAAIALEACEGGATLSGNVMIGYRQAIVAGAGKGLATSFAMIADNIVLRGGVPESDSEGLGAALGVRPQREAETVAAAAGSVAAGRAASVASARVASLGGAAALSGIEKIELGSRMPEMISKSSEPFVEVAERLGRLRAADASGLATGAAAGAAAGAVSGAISVEAGGELRQLRFAIVSAARNATVRENVIAWRGAGYGGILAERGTRLVSGNDLVVVDKGIAQGGRMAEMPLNRLAAEAVEPIGLPSVGIASGVMSGEGEDGLEISGNMVAGRTYAIAVGETDAARIVGNLAISSAIGLTVVASEAVRLEANCVIGASLGALVRDAPRARLERNLIGGTRSYGILAMHTGGAAAGLVSIEGNLLLRCGLGEERAVAVLAAIADAGADVAGLQGTASLVVSGNVVHDTGFWPATGSAAREAVAFELAAPRVAAEANDVAWPLLTMGAQTEMLQTALGIRPLRAAAESAVAGRPVAGRVVLAGNRLYAGARRAIVIVSEAPQSEERVRFRNILVNDNMIEQPAPRETDGKEPTVLVLASEDALVTVSGNVVRGPRGQPSVRVDGPKEIAWSGNATSGPLIGASGQPNVIG